MKFPIIPGEPHREIVAMFFDACTLWKPESGLDFMRHGGFFIAELKCGHAIAVKSDIHIRGIWIQGRPGHEQGFTMRIYSLAQEFDVGFEIAITGYFHPNEVKIVFVEPDVLAARRDGVGLLRGVVNEFAWLSQKAHVAFGFEDAEIASAVLSTNDARRGQKENE